MDIKYKGIFKEFKGNILSKLITVAEDKFDRKLNVSEEQRERCVELKIALIELSKDETEVIESECVKIARQIVDFNRSYRKRKSKKRRNESEEEENDTLGSSDSERLVVNNVPQPLAPPPSSNTIKTSLPPPIPPVFKDRKTESRNFIPLVRLEKSNHEEEEAGELGLNLFRRRSSNMNMRSPLMFGSRRISYLGESNDLQPFPNLDNSGNMSAFNTFNLNFLGNSQTLFMPADMLEDQQKIEAEDPPRPPIKNLF